MDTWIIQMIAIQVLFVCFLIWLVVHYRSKKGHQRSTERIRLLDRFESAEDLEAFLASEPGKHYLDSAGVWRFEARWLVLMCVATGAVALALGVGILLLVSASDEATGMEVPGAILSSLGVGLFLAAGVSWVLVRMWGLDRPAQ